MASIIDYYLNNNCIADAIDHALENDKFDSITQSLDCLSEKISKEDLDELIFKIGSYLLSCADYFTEPDYDHVRSFVVQLYCKYKLWLEASIVTLSNNFNQNLTAIETILSSCVNDNEQAKAKQIACLLNRQSIYLHNYPNPLLKSLMTTSKTLTLFNYVAKELDCQAPFDLRSALPDFLMSPFSFSFHARLSRSKSRTFMLHVASAFANIAHGKDGLTDALLRRTPTIFFNKCGGAEGVSGVIGSLGLINLWNPEVTLNSTLNRFQLYTQPELKAGSILACSLSRSNYRGDDEFDDFLDCPEFDCIEKGTWDDQACCIVGLGTAYSGTNNSEALFILRRLLRNDSVPLMAKGLSALSIGLISISTANHKIASNLLATLLQIDSLVNQPEELVTCWFISLSIGLIYLNRKGKRGELTEQINQLSSEKLKSIVNVTLDCCSFSGSGDVLQIQKMLHLISKRENKTPSNVKANDAPSTSKQDESIKSTLPSHSTDIPKSNIPTLRKRKALERPSPIRKQYGAKSRKKLKSDHQARPSVLNKEKPDEKNRRKIVRLDEFSSINDIMTKIKSKRKVGSTVAMEPNRVRSARRFRRYSLDRRSSLPTTLVRPLKDSLSASYDTNIESDDDSDQPSTMKLIESLEVLNHSLDKIMSQKKGSNKAYITSISTTPPRFIIDSIATIGISLIALGEEIGCSMAKRILQQILLNGSLSSKRMVPLAFALLSLSNPDPQILATLEKCSRYQMISMSINSIFAIGLCGSGSLDQKLSKIINNLFENFDSGPGPCLDALILTKGLLHLGKGLMTLSPYSYNNQLIFPTGLASVLITIFSCLDVRSTFLGKLHHLIYYLTPAIRPRFIVTLDDKKLEPIEVPLGIGEPLNIHEQVGKLRFAKTSVTQNSPVILKDQESAEIYNDHYKPATKFIEGMVIVEKID